jgi:hypothetical protein
MPGTEFLARHPASEHPYLDVVHQAVDTGTCESDSAGSTVSCDALLTIYTQRARHLQQFQTPHAIELRGEVESFCRRLSTATGAIAHFWGFSLSGGVHYLFVERVDTHELIGALRTISKLDVPPDEWRRLWGQNV